MQEILYGFRYLGNIRPAGGFIIPTHVNECPKLISDEWSGRPSGFHPFVYFDDNLCVAEEVRIGDVTGKHLLIPLSTSFSNRSDMCYIPQA